MAAGAAVDECCSARVGRERAGEGESERAREQGSLVVAGAAGVRGRREHRDQPGRRAERCSQAPILPPRGPAAPPTWLCAGSDGGMETPGSQGGHSRRVGAERSSLRPLQAAGPFCAPSSVLKGKRLGAMGGGWRGTRWRGIPEGEPILRQRRGYMGVVTTGLGQGLPSKTEVGPNTALRPLSVRPRDLQVLGG